MTNRQDILELAARLGDMVQRVEGIPNSGMAPQGQTNALALLLALNVPLLRDCAAALKARAHTKGEE